MAIHSEKRRRGSGRGFGWREAAFLCGLLLAGSAWAGVVYNFRGGVKTRAEKGLTQEDLKPREPEHWFFTYTYTFVLYLDDDSSAMIQFTCWKVSLMKRWGLLFSFIDRGESRTLRKLVFDSGDYRFRENPLEYRLGGNFWRGFYPDFRLHLEIPAGKDEPEVRGDIFFHCRTPGWRPGEGPVHYGSPEGPWYDLVVMIPWAEVSGTLRIGKEKKTFKGFGYSDHNTQTVLPTAQLGEIIALRSFSPGFAVNFLEYIAPEDYGKTRSTWILVMKDHRIVCATDKWERELLEPRREPKYGYEYPTRVRVKAETPECRLEGEVKGLKLIEWVDALSELPSFVRPVADRFFEAPVFIRQNAAVEWKLRLPGGEEEVFRNRGVLETTFVR